MFLAVVAGVRVAAAAARKGVELKEEYQLSMEEQAAARRLEAKVRAGEMPKGIPWTYNGYSSQWALKAIDWILTLDRHSARDAQTAADIDLVQRGAERLKRRTR